MKKFLILSLFAFCVIAAKSQNAVNGVRYHSTTLTFGAVDTLDMKTDNMVFVDSVGGTSDSTYITLPDVTPTRAGNPFTWETATYGNSFFISYSSPVDSTAKIYVKAMGSQTINGSTSAVALTISAKYSRFTWVKTSTGGNWVTTP